MTPPIHHLKSVWEIHLSLIRFNKKVLPCVIFESMLPNHWSCHPCVQEQSKPLLSRPSVVIFSFCVGLPYVQSPIVTCSVSLSNSVIHFVSLMWDTSKPSCDESCSVDFSTLSGIKTWKLFNTLKLACLNGNFLAFDSGFTSLTPDREILLSVRHQIIYSQSMDCTIVPWASLTLMVISLALVNGIHQRPVIKWFLPCSTSTHVITWSDSYFGRRD
jgi:hypothetical protein